ncbi:Mbov_0401 family ICE element transposase-like protein [Williamsoniiplasma lucivorax]|uniref:ISLre2 family transposase n=1 Tax=Williamsoniiplasma lucivorax TaxID=209274 RepID=A0A2S5RDJ2_9MOLU|nr:UPF0236 family protein [Williamsoniiplasma lucivorax]PPE05386.1 hypothetical protein ELUCI_v1c04780 [Williamsoniiplasma lucivorax]
MNAKFKGVSTLEKTIQSLNETLIKNLIFEIEKYDFEWFKNRDKKLWKKTTNRKRFLRTKQGKIQFRFRAYKNSETKKWYAPALESFDLVSKSPIPNFLKKEILFKIDEFQQYKAVKASLGELQITHMTISTYNRSLDLHKMEFEKTISDKPKLVNNQKVYIFLDDAYATVKNKHIKILHNKKVKKQVRVLSFNLGQQLDPELRKESRLISKRVGFIPSYVGLKSKDMIEETIESIKIYGSTFYDNFENAQIIIGGDGDKTFKKIAKGLNAILFLDRWHALKYLKDFFIRGRKKYDSKNHQHYARALELFGNGDFEGLMSFIKLFSNRAAIVKYFSSNKEGIQNNSLDYNFGVSVESEVCRLVKSVLGFRNKTLNDLTFMNMVTMRAFKINNPNFSF